MAHEREQGAPDPGLLGSLGAAWANLDQEFDRASFERLESSYPLIADRLRALIAAGATAAEVRRWAIRRGLSAGWADWLESAARGLVVGDFA